jgi:hypothetical protein
MTHHSLPFGVAIAIVISTVTAIAMSLFAVHVARKRMNDTKAL